MQSVPRLLIDGHEEKQVYDFVKRLVDVSPELRTFGWDLEDKPANETATVPSLTPAILSLTLRRVGKIAENVSQTIDYLLQNHPTLEKLDLRGHLMIIEQIIKRCKEDEQQQLKLNNLRVLKLKIDFDVESDAPFMDGASGLEGDLKHQTFFRYLVMFYSPSFISMDNGFS